MDLVEEVNEAIRSFFKEKFDELDNSRPMLEGIPFKSLSEVEVSFLEAPFIEEEIKVAVWSCDGTKSPYPDGFNFVFIKKRWYFLKDEIISYVKDFHGKATLLKDITSCFLTLIPKIQYPININDYIPICMVGSLYKILAKLLAARLKIVIGGLISHCQFAFVPGR